MKAVLIAADHAGVELKTALQKAIPHIEWKDLGPSTTDRVDYPDFAKKLAQDISKGTYERGILICGSGIGMCMTANRFPKVRAALVWNEESTKLSREHNNANVLCLGARLLPEAEAIRLAKIWLETSFSSDPRHLSRIQKIG